jgi:hypothetical protein
MALGVLVLIASACSDDSSSGPSSQIYRSTFPAPSPGDQVIDVPVVLGPTQEQLEVLDARCGRVSGVVRTGIEPGMLFVEVFGFGPDNTNPVRDCVRKLPFYRATPGLPVIRVPASGLQSQRPSAAPS